MPKQEIAGIQTSLCYQWRTVLQAHTRAVEWLESFIKDNPKRISETADQIWVRGDLARYAIDKEPLLSTARNPFCSAGLDETEVHPLIVSEDSTTSCCIQMNMDFQVPTADSVQAYFLGLINDESTFHAIPQLRSAVVGLYGLRRSPISEVLADHLDIEHDAELDLDAGIIEVQGTNSWRWRLVDEGGGMIAIDVQPNWTDNWRRICDSDEPRGPAAEQTLLIVSMLESSPQAMCVGRVYQFLYGCGSEFIIRAVAEFHKPVRLALESVDLDENGMI